MLCIHSQRSQQRSQIDAMFASACYEVNSNTASMANKIITFGDQDQNFIGVDDAVSLSSEAPREVFLDVDMQSSLNSKNYGSKEDVWNTWKISKDVNVKAVYNSLRNIFTWIPGERILLPEFGSRLKFLLYEGITQQTEEAIAAEIRGSVSEWEPRVSIVDIRNISTVDDTEDNTIHLEVIFTIPSLSEEQYTYSFSYNKQD